MRVLACVLSALVSSTVVAQDPNRLTSAGFSGDVLRLNVTDGVQAVRHFELSDPPRVVLDLFGVERSVAEMPAPAPGSSAIEVRTGEHPNYLRVVVDLTHALSAYEVRQSGGLIEVGLGPATLAPSGGGVLIASSPVPDDPSRPPEDPAPVVAVGVEASPDPAGTPAAEPIVAAEPRTVTSPAAEDVPTAEPIVAAPSTPPRAAGEPPNLEDLSTDELLALIEAELEAAGLDQELSAEELIEQVETELEENRRQPAAGNRPRADEPPKPAERRLRQPPRRPQAAPPDGSGERPPFQYVDEEPAKPPPDEDDDNN